MKKLIDDPRHLVRDMLEGTLDTTPGLGLLDDENVIVRSSAHALAPFDRPVAVLSGGGSGHEPAHAGYVGEGMLSGAIVGDVFTSPSVDAVLAGIRAVAGPAGALLIVKNYTGDRLNFGLAAELAAAEGIPTEIAVVADDVALRDVVEPQRRRGIAGTVLVHKLAGAAAAHGLSLPDVASLARRAAGNIGTMGVALGACTVPAVGKPGFELADDEIELGLGIHGEKGVRRTTIRPAAELTGILVDAIVADLGLLEGERIAVLVNGLGATPPIELAVIARHALSLTRAKGLVVERLFSGVYLSALDMPGCSVTLMRLDNELLDLLEAPTTARAWSSDGMLPAQRQLIKSVPAPDRAAAGEAGPAALQHRGLALAIASALEAAEGQLSDLDSRAGDGDLGSSMRRGAEAIRALPDAAFATAPVALLSIAQALRRAIAGSSGPFYAAALVRAARSLEAGTDWLPAFEQAVIAVEQLGGAKPGDRTMVDALRPAVAAWTQAAAEGATPRLAFRAAADAAMKGAEATAGMRPRLGRASYLGDRAVGVPDGGAVAVAIWMQAAADYLATE